MEARFAQHFLKVRNQIASLCDTVETLSKDAHVPVEGLTEIQENLARPLQILSFGDSSSGRSLFMDTILGAKASGELKAKKWSGVQFGEKETYLDLDIPMGNLPKGSLRDYRYVEAPPCELLAAGNMSEVDGWIAKSDLIVWVLSVENPWSNTTWELLEKQSLDILSRSVIVVTKVDRRSAEEMQVMAGHLGRLVEQRLQKPMKFWYTANNGKEDAGYSEVWEQAHTILENSSANNHYLDQCREKLHRVLDLIEDTLDKRARALDSDKGFLSSVEADIDRQREREIQLYAGTGVKLGSEYVAQIEETVGEFYRASGVISTTRDLFKRGVLAASVEDFFLEQIGDKYSGRAKYDCMQILYDCREQWRSRQSHLDERLGVEAGGFQQEAFKELVVELVPKLEKSAKVAVLSLKIRSAVERMLVSRREKLKKIILAFLSLVILSGLLGALKVPPYGYPAWVTLGLAACVFVFYMMRVYATRGAVAKELNAYIYENRIKFVDDVVESYQEMICYFFTGYAPMFESMRKKIVDARESLEPLQERHHNEFLKLVALENENSLR